MDHVPLSPWSGRSMQRTLLSVFVLELIRFMEWLGRKESLFGTELMGRWDVIHLIMSLKNEFPWGVNPLSSIITRIEMFYYLRNLMVKTPLLNHDTSLQMVPVPDSSYREGKLAHGSLQFGKIFPGKHNTWDAFPCSIHNYFYNKNNCKTLGQGQKFEMLNKTIKTGKPTYYMC